VPSAAGEDERGPRETIVVARHAERVGAGALQGEQIAGSQVGGQLGDDQFVVFAGASANRRLFPFGRERATDGERVMVRAVERGTRIVGEASVDDREAAKSLALDGDHPVKARPGLRDDRAGQLCADIREGLGGARDPLAAVAASNYAARKADVPCAQLMPNDLADWRATVEFMLGPFGCGKDLAQFSALDFSRAAERTTAEMVAEAHKKIQAEHERLQRLGQGGAETKLRRVQFQPLRASRAFFLSWAIACPIARRAVRNFS